MSGEATVSLFGNLGSDPELRFTPGGDAVASFSVANTPRRKDASGEWVDGDTTWYRVTCWRRDAEAATERLSKGDRVHVTGRLKTSTYEAKDGSTRFGLDVTADMDGVTLVLKPAKRVEAPPKEDDPWDAPF